jgi:O-methyltransferase
VPRRRPKYVVQDLLNRLGYEVRRVYPPDFDPQLIDVVERVRPYTMNTIEGIAANVSAVEYVVRNEVPGALVECGVWRGGAVMTMALTLLRLAAADRELYLFDTFAGMTSPSEVDVRMDGRSGFHERACRPDIVVDVDEVRTAVESTGYDPALLRFVEGPVQETLPGEAPDEIALLRLDTDWYESTKHELETLYPRIARGGMLIVDDYGTWLGARRAVDEYIAERRLRLLLARVDYTVRVAVKQEA